MELYRLVFLYVEIMLQKFNFLKKYSRTLDWEILNKYYYNFSWLESSKIAIQFMITVNEIVEEVKINLINIIS